MGSVADKIARKVALQARSKVIDLSEFREGRAIAREAGIDGSRFKELVEAGRDPAFAFHVQGLALVSLFAEAISAMPEAKGYVKALAKAEDEYVPDGPPISPLTASYFNMWAFFDLQFGVSRETMGTCILRVVETAGLPAWIDGIVRPMQESRMGFYLHMGLDGATVLLKDIVTRQVLRCHSATGYLGESGQLWYVRLLPPPPVLNIGHHVVLTTPYVVLDGTERRFLDCIDREVARMAAAGGRRKAADAEALLKFGPTANYWNEYIFLAYVNHQPDVIFLAGVPDILESLPQARYGVEPHRHDDRAMTGKATLVFRAALGPKLYRDIEIPGDRSLYDLAAAIVRAYGFDLDHAFGFFPKLTGNIYNAKPRYELFADMGEGGDSLSVKGTTVAQAFPKVGKAMTFLFDYGDEWRFRVEVLAHGEREPRKRYPKVVASVGKAPPQYPDPDDDFDEED